MKPENETPAIISDHAYLPTPDEPWALCAEMVQRKFVDDEDRLAVGWMRCNMAEAAHEVSHTPYQPGADLRFRCPDCVTKNISPCVHGPSGERE
jgi:hypothetical protein